MLRSFFKGTVKGVFLGTMIFDDFRGSSVPATPKADALRAGHTGSLQAHLHEKLCTCEMLAGDSRALDDAKATVQLERF